MIDLLLFDWNFVVMTNDLFLHHTVALVKVLEQAQGKKRILRSRLVLMFRYTGTEVRIFLQVRSSVMHWLQPMLPAWRLVLFLSNMSSSHLHILRIFIKERWLPLQNKSTTETLTEIRYRRTMDWEIPPNPFDTCVSPFYSDQPRDSEYTTDDGFKYQNPLSDTSTSGINFSCPTGGSPCPVYDNGPEDHGANVRLLFQEDDGTNVSLLPGDTLEFTIFFLRSSQQ